MVDISGTGGKLTKRNLLIVGTGVAAGGVLLIHSRLKAGTTASNTASNATDYSYADSNTADSAIDPQTGIPYAEENASGYGDYAGGGGTAGEIVTGVSSNAAWAQAAQAYLVNSGYDPATVSTALGLYLIGAPLTQDQYDIVTAAIAFENYPPNQPPAPHLASGGGGTGQTGGTGGTGTTATVPNVIGQRANPALARIHAAGLTGRTSPVRNPAHEYVVTSENPAVGSKVAKGSLVTLSVKIIK